MASNKELGPLFQAGLKQPQDVKEAETVATSLGSKYLEDHKSMSKFKLSHYKAFVLKHNSYIKGKRFPPNEQIMYTSLSFLNVTHFASFV